MAVAASSTRSLMAELMLLPKCSSSAPSASASKRIAEPMPASGHGLGEQCTQGINPYRALGIGVGYGHAAAPHRAGPGRIGEDARHHVHVELAHDVAQRAQIELVAGCHRAQRLCRRAYFAPQLILVDRVEIVD